MKTWKKCILLTGLVLCTALFLSARKTVAESKNTSVYTFDDFTDFLEAAEKTFSDPAINYAYMLNDSSIISNVKLSNKPKRWSLYQISAKESSLSQIIYFVATPSGKEVLLMFTDGSSPKLQKHLLCEKRDSSNFNDSIKNPLLAQFQHIGEDPSSIKAPEIKVAAAKKSGENVDAGKVLNVYMFDDGLENLVKNFYPNYNKADDTINGVKVIWHHLQNNVQSYQNEMAGILENQSTAAPDDKVDIFVVEADYAKRFLDPNYSLDVIKDVGLSESDIANQYKYTKDLMTTKDGALKGVSWQACPGGLIYRRSIAKKVLGTDDPDEVQEKLSDWEKFDSVAATAKKKGYKMLSGYQDDFRLFFGNISHPIVADGKLSMDDELRKWISQAKTFTQKGYNNKAYMFTDKEWEGLKKKGKVMCYFGPPWFINIFMQGYAGDAKSGSFGDWGFCKGPQPFSWGGTWICAAKETDNINLIRDIMQKMTCDSDIMLRMAQESGEFTNNEISMTKIAMSDYKNDFLGGQNHIKYLIDLPQHIDKSNVTAYDGVIMDILQTSMVGYIEGTIKEDKAWADFKAKVLELYPDMTFDF